MFFGGLCRSPAPRQGCRRLRARQSCRRRAHEEDQLWGLLQGEGSAVRPGLVRYADLHQLVATLAGLAVTAIVAAATTVTLGRARGRGRARRNRQRDPLPSRSSSQNPWIVQSVLSAVRSAAAVIAGCLTMSALAVPPWWGPVALMAGQIAAWDVWRLSFERRAVQRGLGGSRSAELGGQLASAAIRRLGADLIGSALAVIAWGGHL